MDNDYKTAEVVRDLTAALGKPFELPNQSKGVLVPQYYEVHEFAPIDRPLTHIKAHPVFDECDSFATYVNDFKSGISRIFGSAQAGRFNAVLDFHNPAGEAAYCAHQADFKLRHTAEWEAWSAIDGLYIEQVAFAEFLEERAGDVVDPDGATFLEVATTLEAKKSASFKSGIRLHDGNTQFEFVEDTKAQAKGDLTVPTEFKIGLCVYQGEPEGYRIRCLLRYRLHEGKLKFRVQIHDKQKVLHEAFMANVKQVEDLTQMKVLMGTT